MANFLIVEKLDNDVFSFELNGDTANKILNVRNDLLTIGNLTHWKTSQGANLVKEQNIPFGNVTLKNGVTLIVPTSVTDLFDQLFALGYFDWINGTSGSGVDRFTELLDGFDYTNQGNKAVFINAAETQLEPRTLSIVKNSTDLLDMPSVPVPNQILIRNNTNTAYVQIPPPAGANGYIQTFNYISPDPQEFTLGTNASLIMVIYNGSPLNPADWTQVGNVLTILPTVTLVANDQIIALGVI